MTKGEVIQQYVNKTTQYVNSASTGEALNVVQQQDSQANINKHLCLKLLFIDSIQFSLVLSPRDKLNCWLL